MREALSLRRAARTDWPMIWPVWHEVVAAADTYCYDPDTDTDTGRSMWLPEVLDSHAPDEVWLAGTAGTVCGVYHVSRNQGGPGRHVANASYMVSTSARGSGVGRAMVEHSLVRAAELGFRAIQFNAVAATNVHAIRLYEQLGFQTVGRIPDAFEHPALGFVDLLVMHRSL